MAIVIPAGGARFRKAVVARISPLYEWVELVALTYPRYGGAMFIYSNTLYVVGGMTRGGVTRAVEVIDLATLQKSYKAMMPEPRAFFGFGLVGTKLYVLGGLDESATPTNTIYVYDIPNDSWSVLGAKLPKNIAYCASATLGTVVYVIGGIDNMGNILRDTYALDTGSNTVSSKAPLNIARQNHACAPLSNKIYCFGGDDGVYPTQSIEMYDPSTNTWTQLSVALPIGLSGIVALPVVYQNTSYILIIGG